MKPGDAVVYLAEPLPYGTGQIDHVTRTGRLVVMFDDGTEQEFDAHELELLEVWVEARDLLPTADLMTAAGPVPQPNPSFGRPDCT